MQIEINNRMEELEGDVLSVEELLALKKFTFKLLVVRINGNLVPKGAYASTTVRGGDSVQILHLMSGG